jgi:hypothetical protein
MGDPKRLRTFDERMGEVSLRMERFARGRP